MGGCGIQRPGDGYRVNTWVRLPMGASRGGWRRTWVVFDPRRGGYVPPQVCMPPREMWVVYMGGDGANGQDQAGGGLGGRPGDGGLLLVALGEQIFRWARQAKHAEAEGAMSERWPHRG